MLIKSFRELNVYKAAFEASLQIHKISKSSPREEQYEIGSQLRKASKSICANIAEGSIKQNDSSKEFARFLSIALGSSKEVLVWLDYCIRLGYLKDSEYRTLDNEYNKISAMLNKLKSTLK